jgi:hypothetical protein
MSAEAQRWLILHMSLSLDGFVARSDGVIDWRAGGRPSVDHGNHHHHANLELLGQIGLIVLGRNAFEEMAPAWSTSDSAMARILNALPRSCSPTAARAGQHRVARRRPGLLRYRMLDGRPWTARRRGARDRHPTAPLCACSQRVQAPASPQVSAVGVCMASTPSATGAAWQRARGRPCPHLGDPPGVDAVEGELLGA